MKLNEIIEFLRVQDPVTFRAKIDLPIVFDINGMDEFHGLIDIGVFHSGCRPLCYDGMTQITVFRNDSALVTFHSVIMTTETAICSQVANMIQIA